MSASLRNRQTLTKPYNATYAVIAGVATETPDAAKSAADAGRGLSVMPRVPGVVNVVDIDSPYELSGQHTHPDVIYSAAGFGSDSNGKAWKYWLATTPYFHGDAGYENPSVFASDDGRYWQVPPGLTNPVDPFPGAGLSNSDPDMCLVAGTLYLFYRAQTTTGAPWEKICLRTSTDGITWSGETVVLDTSGSAPPNRLQMISPTVIHDGTQFVMWYSKNTSTIQRRTSADAVTWSAETQCTINGYTLAYGFSHVDVIKANDGSGRLFMLAQDYRNQTDNPDSDSSRSIWIGSSSNNGLTWTFGAAPIVTSDLWGQRVIYRTCGIHEARGGKDYFRLWVSGASLNLGGLTENWYIGFTEGYNPNDDGQPLSTVYLAGELVARQAVVAEDMAASRFFARFVKGAKAVFEQVKTWTIRTNFAFIDQGDNNVAVGADWPAGLGFSSSLPVPPLVVASDPRRTFAQGSWPGFALFSRATDSALPAGAHWRCKVDNTGKVSWDYHNGTAATSMWSLTTAGDLAAQRDLTVTRFLYPGAIGLGTGGAPPTGVLLDVNSDNVRIRTKRTPASSADSGLFTGCIAWDDNYLYIKTSAGWKRSALTTF